MRVTDEAWAEVVERADRAELRAAELALVIRIVLQNHDDCLCRHARRMFTMVKPVELPDLEKMKARAAGLQNPDLGEQK